MIMQLTVVAGSFEHQAVGELFLIPDLKQRVQSFRLMDQRGAI